MFLKDPTKLKYTALILVAIIGVVVAISTRFVPTSEPNKIWDRWFSRMCTWDNSDQQLFCSWEEAKEFKDKKSLF